MLLKQCLFTSIAIICISVLQRTLSKEIPAENRNVFTADEFKCRDNLPICKDLESLQVKVGLHAESWNKWTVPLNLLMEFRRNWKDEIVEVVEDIQEENTRSSSSLPEAIINLTRNVSALQTQNLELLSNISEVGSGLRKVENRAERLESDLKDAKEDYKNISTVVSSMGRKNLELQDRITEIERELLAAKDRAMKLESDREKERDERRKFEDFSRETKILLETLIRELQELRDVLTELETNIQEEEDLQDEITRIDTLINSLITSN